MMRRIEWRHETKVPRCVAAVLDGMSFDAAEVAWPDVAPGEWERALYYLHRNQLTLIAKLPANLRAGREAFYRANSTRLSRLRAATSEVIAELHRAAIETVLLKGFARAAEYVPDPDARMHYDIDLYCPQRAEEAAAVLKGIGFEPIAGAESDAAGHLVPLARPTSWKWRGDFFDLETPVHVELHQLLWVPQIEQFSFSGVEEFWVRREENQGYRTLSRHDTLAYRCMHLLRHVLRGDTRAAGVYEIAYFLHQNRFDDQFWNVWQGLYPQDLHQGQAVCFALAQRWFGCEMHAIPLLSASSLSKRILEWMEHSAASPVESFFVPSKHELMLHLALVDSAAAKCRVVLRRLLPLRHSAQMWEDRGAYLARLKTRALYHVKALVPTLSRMLRPLL
jgi:hypothetical protein